MDPSLLKSPEPTFATLGAGLAKDSRPEQRQKQPNERRFRGAQHRDVVDRDISVKLSSVGGRCRSQP